ncbi:BA75_02428T0 [Komagataella pastoris]|uniref:BA75_02428T0 n=1 Tax=Komagataella pastoris TaxID=4922 RepID=A0A1B2JB34_PICPA|nr:BA75_02428T0 [Komagataella pastoris]
MAPVIVENCQPSNEEANSEVINIPIVAYPPFKLRSSLTDKDPVIWVHLLQSYIALIQKLTVLLSKREDESTKRLSSKSFQQLQNFFKVYLRETAEESSQIFSLGGVNPDIISNRKILKLVVFNCLKVYGLVNFNLSGQTLWDFTKIYVKLAYANSKINSNFLSLPIIQQMLLSADKNHATRDEGITLKTLHVFLEKIVTAGNFTNDDLEILSLLLGDIRQVGSQSKKQGNTKVTITPKNKVKATVFADSFTDSKWVETLEVLYNRGTGVHAHLCLQLITVSFFSCSTTHIADLVTTELKCSSKAALFRLFPLTTKVLLSAKFQALNPNLKSRLIMLYDGSDRVSHTSEQLNAIIDLFPDVTEYQANYLLARHGSNIETVINLLLENMSVLDDIPEEVQHTAKRSVYDGKQKVLVKGKRNVMLARSEVTEQLRHKTLQNALKMLYDSDEDEPDDTYDEQERTTGTEFAKKGKTRNIGLDRDDISDETAEELNTSLDSQLNKVEIHLFGILKTSPEQLQKSARKSKQREELKSTIKWSDEQIEGWARMISHQRKRFQLLEEEFIFNLGRGNNFKKKTSYRKPKEDEVEEPETSIAYALKPKPKLQTAQNQNQNPKKLKKRYADKEVNKSKNANHNRKAAHDKKMNQGLL